MRLRRFKRARRPGAFAAASVDSVRTLPPRRIRTGAPVASTLSATRKSFLRSAVKVMSPIAGNPNMYMAIMRHVRFTGKMNR